MNATPPGPGQPQQPARRQWLWLAGGCGLAGWTPAPATTPRAVPPEVLADLPDARLQGSSRLRFFGLQVYDVHLWSGTTPVSADWSSTPLALEIGYLRSIAGSQIAERSLKEMRQQADIAADTAERWLNTMKKTFPDVHAGDRLTGTSAPGRGARMFYNGAPRGDVREPEFARLFFGIWLSPRTSEPAMRQALLGHAPSTSK